MKRFLLVLALIGAAPGGAAAHSPDHDHGSQGGRPPETLGKVSFPTSCEPAVQTQFERGVALLHSFWFPEGFKTFTAVAERDPGCAMAWWGIAINRLLNPFNGEAAASFVKEGQAAIEKARAIGAKTQRERDYIEAAALLYTDSARNGGGSARSPMKRPWRGSSSAIPRISKQRSSTPWPSISRRISPTRPTPSRSRRRASSSRCCPRIRSTPGSRISSSTATTSRRLPRRGLPRRAATRASPPRPRMRCTCPRISSPAWAHGRIPLLATGARRTPRARNRAATKRCTRSTIRSTPTSRWRVTPTR